MLGFGEKQVVLLVGSAEQVGIRTLVGINELWKVEDRPITAMVVGSEELEVLDSLVVWDEELLEALEPSS